MYRKANKVFKTRKVNLYLMSRFPEETVNDNYIKIALLILLALLTLKGEFQNVERVYPER